MLEDIRGENFHEDLSTAKCVTASALGLRLHGQSHEREASTGRKTDHPRTFRIHQSHASLGLIEAENKSAREVSSTGTLL
jgi:hypothetical protein